LYGADATKMFVDEGVVDALRTGEVDVVGYVYEPCRFGDRMYVCKEFFEMLVKHLLREFDVDVVRQKVFAYGVRLADEKARHGAIWHGLYSAIEKHLAKQARAAKRRVKEAATPTWGANQTVLIPDIGTVMELREDWQFRLYNERRNHDLYEPLGMKNYDYRGSMDVMEVVVEAGAVLVVDRIYIRKGEGMENFSSVSFWMRAGAKVAAAGKSVAPQGRSGFDAHGRCRFWAKLSDVNRMRVRVDMNTLAR